MNPDILERVLSCDRLPSLPAVALRVIELTQDKNVNLKELAKVIENDQGLTAKILRTVNSSFYGLRQRCASINQAIVMLGLSAVKTLALGFSLVAAISEKGSEGFDYTSYWRRGLYSGIAARLVARVVKTGFEEESFLGGLLQDVGMVAMHEALGNEYRVILAACKHDQAALPKLELQAFETQHADIGAMLARRWKLPEELVMPIKYHDRPTAAPSSHTAIVRAVGLGNIAADVLLSSEPAGPLGRYYGRAEQWFGLGSMQADDVLRSITQASREVARLLQLDTGSPVDAEGVLKKANKRLLAMTIPGERLGAPLSIEEKDVVCGVANRTTFDQSLVISFEQARAGAGPLSLVIFEIDGLDSINLEHTQATGDAVLRWLARMLENQFRAAAGTVYRFGGAQLAVLLQRTD
ncbi:MAG: HDOD domain-containing protein, partial [Phycisphaerales bacterium]|nr:HDOD domain-containing protein [Phycisphaerales bacterium]